MKIVLFLLLVMSTPSFAEGLATSKIPINVDLETHPSVTKNKAVAEFGALVASQAFTYAKAVKRINGVTFVDVIILDKLCHVTVEESGEKMKASKIECDAGRYFPSTPINSIVNDEQLK